MNKTSQYTLFGLLLAASLASSAFAADDLSMATVKSSDNGMVQYISGGVATSGMKTIDSEAHDYNLKILFVENGEYLADIRVSVADAKGKEVLNATTVGPVLLVKMPAGHYVVNTTAPHGSTITQHVDVGDDHLASYVLRYPPIEH